MLRRTSLTGPALFAVLAATTAGQPAVAQDLRTYNVTLAGAQVSSTADGRTVVVMTTAGDLRGMLTLTLTADGSGEWALVVAHAQDLAEDGTPLSPAQFADLAHSDEGEPHHEYVELVTRGTIGGTVGGATLQLGPEGGLSAVHATLHLQSGSLEFAGATGGGWVGATGLQRPDVPGGTLVISF